jgi:nicotinate-nucleotide adenylyltransferase
MGNRLGVLGGTFDPIHLGHLVLAEEARERCALDAVLFVPAGDPWMKAGRALAPAEDRLRMTELAVASNPSFAVSGLEIDREGPTYAVDTLRALHEREPRTELVFVAGADAIADLPRWREPEALLTLARFVAATRPGPDAAALPDHPAIETLEIPALDISSTDIRARVAAGRSIRYLVPDDVAAHIREAGLYR